MSHRLLTMVDNFYYSNGTLFCDGVSIEEISMKFGTPVFIYSEKFILNKIAEIKKVQQNFPVSVCYAVKANSSLEIVRTMANQGLGFDVVSEGEMRRVLLGGQRKNKIVFSGVGKTEEEITFALKNDIFSLNVESLSELNRIEKISSKMKTIAPISIRINPDVDPETHPYISTGLRENKFGLSIGEGLAAFKKAKEMRSVKIIGIDCHIGSQILSIDPFKQAAEKVLDAVEKLKNDFGIELSHINLGGGLGISYKPNENAIKIETFLNEILCFLRMEFVSRKIKPPEILFELGRSLVGNSGILVTKVLYLKRKFEGSGKNFAIVDAGMNDLMRPSLYNSYHDVIPMIKESRKGNSECWEIVGPICESGDWLAKERNINLRENSLICFASAGAYCSSMASNYNSRRKPSEVIVTRDGRVREIVTRETFDNMLIREI